MKKNKHITININEADYYAIEKEAKKEKRNITDFVRIMLLEKLEDLNQ